MDRDEALKLLRGGDKGTSAFYRARHEGISIPSLSGADLKGANLAGADLSEANLSEADLTKAELSAANLIGANLRAATLMEANLRAADLAGANLIDANLTGARLVQSHLREADLTGAILIGAELNGANLSGAIFKGADLYSANLIQANLIDANLTGAFCQATGFSDLDLSKVRGLDAVVHRGPSSIATDTLSKSRGKIPEKFLRGCGLTPWETLAANIYDPALTPPQLADLQYRIFDAWTKGKGMINGCFISYSHADSKFVDKLRDRLLAEGVNIWLDRHDMVAGTIQDQIWRAIQIQHVVILVLSETSVKSDWVENELDMARGKEKDEARAVLCPVALDDAWKSKVDAKVGPGDPKRPLWLTLTSKLVLDFSGWKTKAFIDEFAKLLRGLKVNYGPGNTSAGTTP